MTALFLDRFEEVDIELKYVSLIFNISSLPKLMNFKTRNCEVQVIT